MGNARRKAIEKLPPDTSERESVVARLDKVRWDFSLAPPSHPPHAIHPYPAKFIPQLPSTVIRELSEPGDRVCDPFCGSGTTLVEAALSGRRAVGIDANPIATLISRVKTTRLIPPESAALDLLAQDAEGLARSVEVRLISEWPDDRPDESVLAFWFESHVANELAQIKRWIGEIPLPAATAAAQVAMSSIIVAVSKQDSDTRYTRREKNIKPGETLQRFAAAVRRIAADLDKAWSTMPPIAVEVVEASTLDEPEIGEVDLVVTSPPYPNAYSYHLYHRLRMLWLDMDADAFKASEIGSHRKYSAKGARAITIDTFRSEMTQTLGYLRRHLKHRGFVVVVVGDSKIRGEIIDNAALISEVGSRTGFSTAAIYPRKIKQTRRAFNPMIGRIGSESVVVLHRT